MRIAHNPGHAGKLGKLFRCALRVATGDDNSRASILAREIADRSARLRVRGSRDSASVDDDYVRCGGITCSGISAVEKLPLDGRRVRLRSATPEVFDVKGWHSQRTPPREPHNLIALRVAMAQQALSLFGLAAAPLSLVVRSKREYLLISIPPTAP